MKHPDTITTLDEFAEWYLGNGMPIINSENYFCIESDDAVATRLYMRGRFMVEMYFMLQGKTSPSHGHPNVETMIVVDGNVLSRSYDVEMHGGEGFGSRKEPYVMISLSKWDEGVAMTSAAINWVGYTAGEKHDKLIARYYPDAVSDGYADVRKSKLYKS